MSLVAEWTAADAERDARRERERAEYLESLRTQPPLSAEHIAANLAYKAAKKAARKAGVSMHEFHLNYGKTLSK